MSWLERFFDGYVKGYKEPQPEAYRDLRLHASLADKMVEVYRHCDGTTDLVIKKFTVGGVACALLMFEGLYSTATLAEMTMRTLMRADQKNPDAQGLLDWVRGEGLIATDQKEIYTYGELWQFSMSGFALLLIDGVEQAVVIGAQGFSYRSISQPDSEVNLRGSREGFVEALRVNMSMIRRRMKTPSLQFEPFNVGTKSHTDGMLVYLSDTVSPKLLRSIRHSLTKITIEVVLDTGYLQPFLEGRPLSLFSGSGVTERPDVLSAKLAEGRVALLLDGTPFALIVPYLFAENFQSMDDYSHRPFYASMMRLLKYFAFLMTVLLPGGYVAVVTFHPELLPKALLFTIADSVESTPFPMVLEAFIIHLLYEVMREAGVRLPRAIGHAVSIIGGLVIGDAAVRAGIVGTPMVMIVALTAISSFVVPGLYEPVTVLRFAFILIGGAWGLFGITLAFGALLVNLCALEAQGIPVMAPASPFRLYSLRDLFVRWSWKTLQRRHLEVQDLPGSHLNGEVGSE